MLVDRERTTRLHEIIATIQRRWGVRALRRLGQPTGDGFPVVATGFTDLDAALAIGGVPRGRITEFLGSPTSGMSTIVLTLMARAQAQGDLVAYLDLPTTFDAEYAAWCGLELAALTLIRPRQLTDALDIVYALLASGGLGVLVIDDLSRMIDAQRGAALLETALRVWRGALATSACALIVLTRLPYRPAAIRSLGFQGSLLGHAAAVRLHIAHAAWLEHPDPPLGCRSRITVLKHQLAPPGAEAHVTIRFEDYWSLL
jgi:recombination protein RecA